MNDFATKENHAATAYRRKVTIYVFFNSSFLPKPMLLDLSNQHARIEIFTADLLKGCES